MKISVVVATYNQPRFLDLVLHGFEVQADPDFDVIVADDGSGPETAEIVERCKERSPFAVRHVWHEDDGFRKCAILNGAIAESEADYLIFTDGDFVPKPNFVSVHRRLSRPGHYVTGNYTRLSRSTTEAVTPEVVRSGRLFNPLWLARHGGLRNYRLFKPRLYMPEAVGLRLDRFGRVAYGRFAGGNASCFRADALAVDGFNENMVYGREDREFGTRLRNYGISPIRLHSATCTVHLDHDRPWRTPEGLESNLRILQEAKASGRISWR